MYVCTCINTSLDLFPIFIAKYEEIKTFVQHSKCLNFWNHFCCFLFHRKWETRKHLTAVRVVTSEVCVLKCLLTGWSHRAKFTWLYVTLLRNTAYKSIVIFFQSLGLRVCIYAPPLTWNSVNKQCDDTAGVCTYVFSNVIKWASISVRRASVTLCFHFFPLSISVFVFSFDVSGEQIRGREKLNEVTRVHIFFLFRPFSPVIFPLFSITQRKHLTQLLLWLLLEGDVWFPDIVNGDTA